MASYLVNLLAYSPQAPIDSCVVTLHVGPDFQCETIFFYESLLRETRRSSKLLWEMVERRLPARW